MSGDRSFAGINGLPRRRRAEPAQRPRLVRAFSSFVAGVIGVAVGVVIGVPSVADAQTTPVAELPDRIFDISTTLGVDQATDPFYNGSVFATVRQANAAVTAPNIDYVSLNVAPALINLSIILTDPIPAIDLSNLTNADPRVDINAKNTPGFLIRTAADVPADFVLLHVMSGRADLVDVNIASGRIVAGQRVPLRMIVDSGATLGFRYTQDFALDENITGAGSVRIETDKVVSFNGTNDWTGGTRIAKGTLRGNVTSLPGDFLVDPGGVLDFRITNTTQTSTFLGNVTGGGKLLKSGVGTLLLSGGTASHTGGTEVTTGTLQTTPASLTGNVAISQGARLWLLPDGVTPFAGSISGAGSVRKSGNTEVVLSGANTFTGGLFIQNGDVRGTTVSIPGNVTLEAVTPPDLTARLFFDQDTDGTHIGTISGAGVLLKQGSGRVLRQGITNVSLVQVLNGRLAGDVASLGNSIEVTTAGAIAEFSLADQQTYAGSISGPGDVWKTGTGTLFVASPLLHSGRTVVNAGTLQLGADLVNSTVVQVDPGGRLANVSGGIPAGRLVNQGRVSAGSPTTSLPVSGNATLAAGSVLEVALDSAGNASSLVVGGAATLDAPSYQLGISPGDYSVATQYSVLVASSIAIAPGSSVGATVDDLAFISVTSPPSVIAGPGVAQVVFSLQEDFSNIPVYGTTPNQVSTGVALEQVTNSGSADARTIRNGLVPLRVDEVPAVLDMMAGETLSGFTNSRIANARNFADTLLRRLHTSHWELSRPPTVSRAGSAAPPAVGAARSRGSSGAWLVPFGLFSDNDGNGNASDMDTDTYGVTGGLDYRLPAGLRLSHSENYRFGVALGYTHHSLENSTGFMSGTGNTAQTALYGGYRSQHFHAGLAGRFAWTSMQSDRHIVFSDVDRTALASFDGLEWGALMEAGGHFGDPKRALFHPIARFQYIHTTQDAFQETGAGDLDLAVPSLAYDSFLLTLGARVSRVFTLKGEFGIAPELRGGWTIDFGDLERDVPASFYVVPGAVPFVTTGAQPDMNSGSVGIGYVMTVGDVPLLSTHYDFEAGQSFTRHIITAGLYFRW